MRRHREVLFFGRVKHKSSHIFPNHCELRGDSVLAVNTYEGMFLLDSNKYAANHEGTIAEILALLARVGATVLAQRPWQDTKLTYPIKGQRKGLYFLTYFTLETQQLTELGRLCKLSETILRQMLLKLDPVGA